ncbi:class I adenylate-forming enzyme family protein [Nocardioides daejeonensis]|uniref:class I adenylate-forming enzyme family protein n=1 Tax=Nocardioides daejeonensis TaxID=1046556 RepID=UPI000D7484D8|nr:class I adenylate-forming enzyme family protein [Nocardioides daejeonensis]
MTTRDEVVARLTALGAPFEIGLEDVLGHDLEVFSHRERSVGELLRRSLEFGDREYLVTPRLRLTFAEHLSRVAALATALRDRYGVQPGDRVAICAANSPEWVMVFWATTALGAVTVGMNAMGAAPELAHALDLTEPAVVIADDPRRRVLGESEVPLLAIEDDVPRLIEEFRGADLPEVKVAEDDPAVIFFTSGTTGRPKGATHSHRNVVAAVWFHLLNDAVAAELGHPQTDRRYLLVTPLFHIAALHNLAVVRMAVGDTAVIHEGKFDIDRVLRLIEQERVTNWGAVPTMLSRLVEADLSAYDLSSLRTISVGSAPSSPSLKQRLREALPAAGQSLGTTYGLTESSTAATLATAAELAADPETVGRPVPTQQVQVRDADGNPVADGVEGEIHLRGVHMMLGYWRDPGATMEAHTDDGWFRTGDLGSMRDGQLRIASRRSDLIIRGGENVYPAEVEAQLVTHPSVRECIVLGVPDADFGQAVSAVVVVDPDGACSEEELREFLRERLARYKVPTRWRVTTEELPRNATGKVNRRQVVLP